MEELPRTPVNKNEPVEGVGTQEIFESESSKGFLVHGHGITGRKKYHKKADSSSYADLDLSIDCIVRGSNIGDGGSDEKRVVSGGANAFDKIDVQKMFNKQETTELNAGPKSEPLLTVEHSPIKLNFSSPVRVAADEKQMRTDLESESDDLHINKKPKLEFGVAPVLQKPSSPNVLESSRSPVAINMVETETSPDKSSNMRENEAALELQNAVLNHSSSSISPIKNDEMDEQENVTPSKNGNEESPEFHKLTPLFGNGISKKFREHGSDLGSHILNEEHSHFKAISIRNEELVDQVYQLNKSLNSYMAEFENSEYISQKNKLETESILAKLNEELTTAKENADAADAENVKSKEKLSHLKLKLGELRDEIKMLSQNQRILQDKYDMATKEVDDCKLATEEMKAYSEKKNQENIVTSRLVEELELKLSAMDIRTKELEEKIEILEKSKETYKEKLESSKKEQIDTIAELHQVKSTLEKTVTEQKGSKEDMIKQVDQLLVENSRLETKLSESILNSAKENEKIQAECHKLSNEVATYKSKLETISGNESTLNAEMDSKVSIISQLKQDLEKANDDVEINKAQVIELNIQLEQLKDSSNHFKDTASELEISLKELQETYKRQTSEYERSASELENLRVKNNNIESEHLAELESLHEDMKSLQLLIEENSATINQLKQEKDKLFEENEQFKQKQLVEVKTKSDSPDSIATSKKVTELETEVRDLQQKLIHNDEESNKRLKLLAEDLYVQYSSKHEQKVKLLKKGYDTKYQSKLDQISLQNQGLLQEIEQMKSQLTEERNEKQKLLQLLDNK